MKDEAPTPRKRRIPLPKNSTKNLSKTSSKAQAHLVGVAFKNDDGHKRITKGEKFTLVGGSQTTHEAMTESVVKTFETLKRKGRTLETADPREVAELLQKHYPRT